MSGGDFAVIRALPQKERHPFATLPKGNGSATWVAPIWVCTVKYMQPTANGGMRQPVFKGLWDDKEARECLAPTPS